MFLRFTQEIIAGLCHRGLKTVYDSFLWEKFHG
jgi:hypothetical protein